MVKKSLVEDQPKNPLRTYWQLLVGFLLVVVTVLLVVVFVLIQYIAGQPDSLSMQQEQNSVADESVSEMVVQAAIPSHPVFVMIDNHFEAWDHQFGLSFAPVVYSTLVEGGATRFMALFDVNNTETRIGPVRSVRPYFLPWVAEYNGLLAHVGGAPQALEDIVTFDVENLNEMTAYGPIYFNRDDTYPAPHNTFTTAGDLREALTERSLINEQHLEPSHFAFLLEPGEPSDEQQVIYIDYAQKLTYDVEYTWNPTQAAYVRYRFGEAQRDSYNGAVIGIRNVIIQRVPAEEVLDSDLRIALDVVGVGEAYFFKDGRQFSGTWKKEARDLPTRYFAENGDEFVFSPGNVWIEIVPVGHEVSVNEEVL